MLGTQLYHQIVASEQLLQPTKSAEWWGTKPATLKEIRPVLRGWWIFKDPNDVQKQQPPPVRNAGRPKPMQQASPAAPTSASGGLIVLRIDWTDDVDGTYDKTDTKFYRLKPGTCAPRMNMDINLLELGE